MSWARAPCSALARVATDLGAGGLGTRAHFAARHSSAGACIVVQPDEDSPSACFAAPFADRALVSGDDAVGDGLTRLLKTVLHRGGGGAAGGADGAPTASQTDTETRRKLGFLRAVKSLAFLGDEQLLQMAEQMQSQSFAQGDAIVAQGDVAEDFFVIQNGAARVYVAGD